MQRERKRYRHYRGSSSRSSDIERSHNRYCDRGTVHYYYRDRRDLLLRAQDRNHLLRLRTFPPKTSGRRGRETWQRRKGATEGREENHTDHRLGPASGDIYHV